MLDSVFPFSLYDTTQKGRLVFLEDSIRGILTQHNYPPLVNHYILELTALLSVMGSDSKTKALTTLQITADKNSPISTLVVDMEHDGAIRAYARFNEESLKKLDLKSSLKDFFINGYMLFCVDFEKDTKRYQAIVELVGETLTTSMQHYSKQSDQIPTLINVHVADLSKDIPEKGRLAAALMLQQLPLSQNAMIDEREKRIDEWVTSVSFMKTLKINESLDNDLDQEKIIYRLFHEANPIMYAEKEIHFRCRCSLEKITHVIKSFGKSEKESLIENGTISVDCEFCSKVYILTEKDIE